MNNVASSDWVEHTLVVMVSAQDALATVDDMEVSYEQFLLTGSSSRIAGYQKDLTHLRSQLADLAQLTADNPPQVERWNEIAHDVEALDANDVQPMVSLRRALSAGSPRQQDLLIQADGRNVEQRFVTVRDAFAAGLAVEHELLLRRQQAVDRDEALLMNVLIGGIVAVGVIGVLIAVAFSSGIVLARKRDVDERIRAQAATESLLNAAAEGIWALDSQGCVTMMNESAQRMTGYPLDELRGKLLHTIIHHSRADGSPYPAEECPTGAAIYHGEVRHVRGEVYWRKDGSSFPVEYTAVPIEIEAGLSGAVVSFHDITEQLAIDRMKDEFISVVSHELKTPLTSLRGSLGLLAGGVLGPLPERGSRMLEVALSNTDRLIRLVSDIVDVEGIASGRVAMQLEVEDATELAERSVSSVADTARSAGVRVDASVAEPIEVVVDSDRILQTLTHLLNNAIKFSERGSDVLLEVRRDTDRAVFSVRDHGSGIAPENLESIFRRFGQVDTSDTRRKGGTGLGLAIASIIVRQHGGTIWAESTLGQGSTFYFTVPIHQPG